MTAEIAIMNKQGISLAADSATTVTQWVEGKQEIRYFKGANKIFELSTHAPIGIMINDSASLQNIPWDIIIKQFRNELGDKTFNDLIGYANELFEYIKNNNELYPNEYRLKILKDDLIKVASIQIYIMASRNDEVKNATNSDEKSQAYNNFISNELEKIDNTDLPTEFTEEDINSLIQSQKNELVEALSNNFSQSEDLNGINLDELAKLSIKLLIKHYETFMSSTGVVFAGYGDHDYFPGFIEFNCYGLLYGKFLAKEKSKEKISVLESPGFIKPFAQTSMIDTFWTGFSPDVYSHVESEFFKRIRAFSQQVVDEKDCGEIDNLDEKIKGQEEIFAANWTENAYKEHAWPFNRVIGALPIDEMAELAETLISLQSLKEKVTRPTESVSGPVDVAVITKGDGFIWIKRKMYFDKELNPRYFARTLGNKN